MLFAMADEFGCNKVWRDKSQLSRSYDYHPTRGYGGFIIPAKNIDSFLDEFLIIKALALRDWCGLRLCGNDTKNTKLSIQKLMVLDSRVLARDTSIWHLKSILRTSPNKSEIRKYIINAEIKSNALFRLYFKKKKNRYTELMLRKISDHCGEIFFSGFEKKTMNAVGEDSIISHEVIETISVLRRIAFRREEPIKLFFDRHNIDERTKDPFFRKKIFDAEIQRLHLSKWFPETVTLSAESRYSLCIQVSDWCCGIIARHLALCFEPQYRKKYGKDFPPRVKSVWENTLSPESTLRNLRRKTVLIHNTPQPRQLELGLKSV